MSEVANSPETRFSRALAVAAKLPGVRIDRESYLRNALRRECSEDEISRAIIDTPAAAGISADILQRAARSSVKWEATKAATLSGAAGLPGAFGMIAAVPADVAQYFGHMLRIAQKLAYLYSWPDLFANDADEMDDGTKGVLTLFMGVMFGVQSANAAVGKLSTIISEQVVKKLPQKALTQGVIYPIVKKVAANLGMQMTKQTFARSVAKVVPILGGIISAGVTLATFIPMAHKLRKHFAILELAIPAHEIIDADDSSAGDSASIEPSDT